MKALVLIIACVITASGCGQLPFLARGERPQDFVPAYEQNAAARPLSITVIDVGQGDAILIEAPSGEAALVDAGPRYAGRLSVLPLLRSRGIEALSWALVTHYHADHYAGLTEIAAGPDGIHGTEDDTHIGGIYERGESHGAGADALDKYGPLPPCPRKSVSAGDRIQLGDVYLEVVAANALLADGSEIDPGEPPDENALGIALVLGYSGFRMLLAADITGGGGSPPYVKPDVEGPLGPLVGAIDVLKVAHHGSGSSTSEAFLDAVSPAVAIISVGDGNDYGHPHPEVIERLLASGAMVFQTERGRLELDGPIVADGDVTIEVDEEGNYRVVLN